MTVLVASSLASPLASSTPVVNALLAHTIRFLLLLSEEFLLKLGDILEEYITIAEVDLSFVSQVSIHTWQQVLIHHHNCIKSSFSDL